MIIIWGKSIKTRTEGVVADRCVLCQSITTANVETVHCVPHLYYIPIGGGELVQNQSRCNVCGGVVLADPRRYDRVLDTGEGLSTLEILERTNSALAKDIKRRGALEHSAEMWMEMGVGADTEDDPRLQLALERLSEIPPDDEGMDALVEKTQNWEKLDDPQRRMLVAKVAELHKAAAYRRNVATHIYWAAQRFSPGQWGWGVALFIVLAIIGFSFFFPMAPRDQEAEYMMAILGLCLAATVGLMIPFHRFLYRRFFRKVFIPRALERGIKPEDSLAWLEDFSKAVNSREVPATPDDAPIRELAKVRPRLREVLAKQSGSGDPYDAS